MKFFNTLTGKKEDFQTLQPGQVGLYTCGPTVYDLAHIGNFRAYVFEDLLHRYLLYRGYAVTRVMNITDVDDKTIAGCLREGISLKEFTNRYLKFFLEDMESLRLLKPDYLPRATEHIPEMVSLIKTLLEKGFAYMKDGSIYFRISKFPSYGKLAHLDLSAIKPGARVEVDEYSKEDVRDFALWKAEPEGQVAWETELGRGRPGWHIECSAMSMKYLGETFDIHTGGIDNIFPHHENEIAQSEAATGKPFVRYWLHCAHLLVNNEKMSKSKGNFYTLRDLLNKGYNPLAVRYLLLSTHYRDPLNFTETSLAQATNTLRHYQEFFHNLSFYQGKQDNQILSQKIDQARKAFIEHLDDDLNISPALAAIFELIKEANIALNTASFSAENVRQLESFFLEVDQVLAILERRKETLEEEIVRLIRQREEARKAKNFKKADEIREELLRQGIVLEDTPAGTRWHRRQ
ncbi:MAG: cysteine--tRNA ligase [Candidatus Omnitrophica bacterium]|nr:cysteine--tRNA ligase [Candidatus Omnitrophota bacterium]MCM8768113.1 cysteine--tRNA ligase [Candidatus Omnitrophota bacterium]